MSVLTCSHDVLSMCISAGSTMSLMMGVLFAALIGYGAYRTSNNPRDYIPLLSECCDVFVCVK